MFNRGKDKEERQTLAEETDIPLVILDELVCLSDLSRAYGVGPVFARLIFDVGIKSIKEFIALGAEDFFRIYEEKKQKKADFGVNEIQFRLDLARELAIGIEV
jgi:nucleotidyltransferase/DNA polymerase involved in DNA repair